MQHRRMSSASSTVELSYLLPTEDEESEPGILSPRLLSHAVAGLRASKFFLGRSRWILHALRSVVRAANLRPEESKFDGARGFIATVFGFTTSNEDELKETAWLDGLRGVAAFFVMVNHYHLDTFAFSAEAPYGSSNTQPWEIWRLPYFRIIWCSGSLQVGIFFVLSGFVLSWSSLSSIREGRPEKFVLSLSSSAFRRWMRLFVPCFLIGLLSLVQFYIGLIDLPVITRKNSFVAQFVDYIWECQRFANPFTLDREGWDVRHKYNATMWTMLVEWAGSLIVFVVLLSVSRIQNFTRRAIVLLGVPIYCCLSAKWNYWLFTTGILLADYVKQAGGFEDLSKRMTFRSRFFWVSILLIGGWLGGIPGNYGWYERPGYEWLDQWVPRNWQEIENGQRYFWCWSGIMVIWGVSHFATLRHFFERPSCRYLGRISFMLYLTHRMVGTILGPPIRSRILNTLGTHHRPSEQEEFESVEIRGFFLNIVAYSLAWACMLPLALALANWSTILVDEPSVKFAKWVDDKFVNGFVHSGP